MTQPGLFSSTDPILTYLQKNGPSRLATMRSDLNLSKAVANRMIKALEKENQIIIEGGNPKSIRLVGQPPRAASISSRRFQNMRGTLGADASEELVERALEVYESGAKPGTFGLSQALGCSHAEAISCVAKLRSSGRIRNYGETYIATVPYRGKAA